MTRNNSSEDDGEVILVMKGATLTVNGGTRDTSHEVYVYNSTSKDHLFVAQWKKSTTPGNDDESNTENGIKTGDDSNILLWLTLMTLSLIALVFIVIHRRKKNE